MHTFIYEQTFVDVKVRVCVCVNAVWNCQLVYFTCKGVKLCLRFGLVTEKVGIG